MLAAAFLRHGHCFVTYTPLSNFPHGLIIGCRIKTYQKEIEFHRCGFFCEMIPSIKGQGQVGQNVGRKINISIFFFANINTVFVFFYICFCLFSKRCQQTTIYICSIGANSPVTGLLLKCIACLLFVVLFLHCLQLFWWLWN